jgi:hypothetical protein
MRAGEFRGQIKDDRLGRHFEALVGFRFVSTVFTFAANTSLSRNGNFVLSKPRLRRRFGQSR